VIVLLLKGLLRIVTLVRVFGVVLHILVVISDGDLPPILISLVFFSKSVFVLTGKRRQITMRYIGMGGTKRV
jgi:hypothetical protein